MSISYRFHFLFARFGVDCVTILKLHSDMVSVWPYFSDGVFVIGKMNVGISLAK